LASSFGCCQRHERKRTHAADCGTSDVAGAPIGGAVAAVAVGASTVVLVSEGFDAIGVSAAYAWPEGWNESLLKLYANGFLQRAERAQFLGSDQRQRAPR
jgi:hypothetical protein